MAAENSWTLLFFLASDSPSLAPLMITELKALKDAGFQKDTTVLAHFDPSPLGVPTRIYNVNRCRKLAAASAAGRPQSHVGDDNDPFVRNLAEDEIQPDEIEATAGKASAAVQAALRKPRPRDADDTATALERFLGFARENHPARHYILFLIGHGTNIANDAFLPDDNPVSALSLQRFGDILARFSADVRADGGELELLSLHSCSMSSVEVAYQLKGSANYVMATQGPAFVNSWPYRQLLKKVFNAVEAGGPHVNVPKLLNSIFSLSLYNGTDFMSAGYSSDLVLCSLRENDFRQLSTSVKELVSALKRGLKDGRVTQLILLAHWRSQSYWHETYTDLFDFCRCLQEVCDQSVELQKSVAEACGKVRGAINRVVVRSDIFGPAYQYSHGLSVYFPWSRPIEDLADEAADVPQGIFGRYKGYAFTTELGDDSWLSFLDSYLAVTLRPSRRVEDEKSRGVAGVRERLFKAALESFDPLGPLATGVTGVTLDERGKPLPSVGLDCGCPSIKNYPQETQRIHGRTRLKDESFPITDGALEAFS